MNRIPESRISVTNTSKSRGKAYVNVRHLSPVRLQGVPEPVYVFRYDSMNYILASQAAHLCGHGEDTVRTTVSTHQMGKSFLTNAALTFHKTGVPVRRATLPTLRKRLYVNLDYFATFCERSNWAPEIFGNYTAEKKAAWQDAIDCDIATDTEEVTAWREKAYCDPEDNFLGLKKDSVLSQAERVKLIRRGCIEGSVPRRPVRRDKILLEHEIQASLLKIKSQSENEIIIELPKNACIIAQGNLLTIKVTH